MAKKNVALIYGGNSSEWQISILSGKNVAANMDRSRYNVYEILLRGTSWSLCDPASEKPVPVAEVDKTDFSCMVDGVKVKFDIAFLMIHGTPGEDGLLQGYFEMMGIPHTTCSSFVSALTFNKYSCKAFLREAGVHLAKDMYIRKGAGWDAASVVERLGLPVFVKPVSDGSSFGISKVKKTEDLASAVELAFTKSDAIIIEEAVTGRELTEGAFMCKGKVVTLPITEIVTDHEYFDYDAKYLGQSREICPAPIPESVAGLVREATETIYRHFGCRGVVRMDYIFDGRDVYFLEANTVPGMTKMSLVPNQARAAGISVGEFINILLEEAVNQNNQ